MDMERRSAIDRTRELPNLKRPRVSEDTSTNSRVPSSNTPLNPRYRTNEREREREREDSSSYHQQLELIAQYKTAISELTFNSKPIITNLTIIAGENLHAAKGIAATVCSNILEVPSDQKLPSLYLLDSIVKNIGKDYIRHFASKLPEVFCKAYKQVEPPIHNSMRHLFSTWKSVFPPTTLQIIEKELGFSPTANGSSQRPPQSIHVNPKYLEARQRLQLTNSKEMDSDEEDNVMPNGDVSRLAVTENARQWPDPSSKMHNIQRQQREPLKEPKFERKGTAMSRLHDPRIKERAEFDKTYYGKGSEGTMNSKNSHDANHSFGKHRAVGLSQSDRQIPPVSTMNKNVPTPNWKNSEEEEYVWDDMNDNNSSIKGAGLQRGQLIPSEDQLDLHHKAANFPRPRSSTAEDISSLFKDVDDQQLEPPAQLKPDMRAGDDSLSTWPPREPGYLSVWPPPEPKILVASQTQTNSRYPGKPPRSSSPTNIITPLPRPDNLPYSQPPSSMGLKLTKLPNSTEVVGQQRHQKPKQPPSHLNKSPQKSTTLIPCIQEEKSPNVSPSPETSASDLLAAIMKTGLLPNNISSTSGSSIFNNIQPPLPDGPPPSQAAINPLPSAVLPPLPPGPPPSQKLNISSPPDKNPFSSLLSSLVAKGIIASTATDVPAAPSVSISNDAVDQSTEISSSSSELMARTMLEEDEATDATELNELIGVDFKPEIIREFHPWVISSLFNDLKHQCDVCGLRAQTQQQLEEHLELHSSEKNDELSRKWYSDKNSWVFGDPDFFEACLEEMETGDGGCEPMVPADEGQCICALCGEPFEDFYCHERDEWMFKGTVYLDPSFIVHAKCTSSLFEKAENNGVMQL